MGEIEKATFPYLSNQNDSEGYESSDETRSDGREDRIDIRISELWVDNIA